MSASVDPFERQHRNWAQWFGRDWQTVRAETSARVQAAIERWGLCDVEPFGSGGVGYVYRARLRNGEQVVLKVEPVSTAWAPLAADRALVLWSRAGLAPRVISARDDGRTLLLEMVTPGQQLGVEAASIDESFPVIGDMARRLRRVRRAATDGPFPTLAQHAERGGWPQALERHYPDAVHELNALLAQPTTTLIHNDLYQDNLLWGGDAWLVIDPKPVLADAHAECFAFLAAAEYVTGLSVFDRYARAADLPDLQLLMRWVRIRALITTAQRSDSAAPTAASEDWDAHVRALARMLDSALA